MARFKKRFMRGTPVGQRTEELQTQASAPAGCSGKRNLKNDLDQVTAQDAVRNDIGSCANPSKRPGTNPPPIADVTSASNHQHVDP
jgi:hypothetical protein